MEISSNSLPATLFLFPFWFSLFFIYILIFIFIECDLCKLYLCQWNNLWATFRSSLKCAWLTQFVISNDWYTSSIRTVGRLYLLAYLADRSSENRPPDPHRCHANRAKTHIHLDYADRGDLRSQRCNHSCKWRVIRLITVSFLQGY